MKTRRTPTLEQERDAWKAKALASEAVIASLEIEIAESWRAQRAMADYEQRVAADAEMRRAARGPKGRTQ